MSENENPVNITINGRHRTKNIGLWLGPALALMVFIFPAPEGLPDLGWKTAGLAFWMATWWATEAMPIAVTSLLPMAYLPIMGIATKAAATTPYAHPVIMLLFGGFMMAMAMQRWNLHKRIALNILIRVGGHPSSLIGGFMLATAVLSMWISNTASALMMMPIALSVAENIAPDGVDKNGQPKTHAFTLALLLGIAYSASIGGLGTIIGTAPNALVVAYLADNNGFEITFVQWMMFGVPIVICMLPTAWFVLTKLCYPHIEVKKGGGEVVQQQLDDMGPITTAEKRTGQVFGFIAFLWIFGALIKQIPLFSGINDTSTAIMGVILMFVVPAGCKNNKGDDGFLLNWEWANKIPWGVLLLFGGGVSLAGAVGTSGLALWLGDLLAVLTTFDLIIFLAALVAMIIFLTELTSNTATVAMILPVLGAIALKGDYNPLMLAAPAAMAGSCAFMLPVATGPNAVIFAGGKVRIPDMVQAGLRLNILGIFIVTLLCYMLVPIVFDL